MEEYTSVSVRIKPDTLNFIDDNSGRGKRFKDRSVGFRYYLEFGMKTESLINTKKDPEKWKDFEEKIVAIMSTDKIPHVLETMPDEQLDDVMFYAANIKNKRATQLILNNS